MLGTVCEVDKSGGMVRLDVLGRVTNWLPCVTATPSMGQQVAFLEYDNDGTGIVLGSTARSDGSAVTLHIGDIDITIDGESVVLYGDTKITGEVEIVGNLTVDGNIEITGDITDSRGDLSNFVTTDGAQRA